MPTLSKTCFQCGGSGERVLDADGIILGKGRCLQCNGYGVVLTDDWHLLKAFENIFDVLSILGDPGESHLPIVSK